jgi:hypothetical protein
MKKQRRQMFSYSRIVVWLKELFTSSSENKSSKLVRDILSVKFLIERAHHHAMLANCWDFDLIMATGGLRIRAQGLKIWIIELGHHQCAVSDQKSAFMPHI